MAGCAHVDPHAANIRGVAYVRVDEIVKHHPLYAQLDQLNDAIAAINLEASLPHAPLSAAEIAAQTQALNAQVKAAQEKVQSVLGAKQQEYQQKEHDADVAALKAANIDPAAAGLGAAMNATSQQQVQAAAAAAQSDFAQYQASVVSQDSAAARAIAQQLGRQADEKYRARAEQYQQDETDLSLRLAQQDASQRLAFKTKLNNLAMDADSRKSVADGLAAIDKKEADQTNALRAEHVRDLAAYRTQLGQETNAAIGKQMTTLRGETNAKLSARQAAVGAQLRGLGAAPVASQSLPPDIKKKLMDIHQQFATQFQTDAQNAMTAYNQTKSDLDLQFAALHGQNVGAVGAAAKQLADLQKRHDDLQAQIQSQIQRESERIAKEMGFTVVFDNVQAAAGGYDMTNDVLHDIESLHE
jgi:Outer membrane protein (OmpH-like)